MVDLRFISQEQPSLAGVAVVLLFAMRFADDDGHSVLPDMKSNPHANHLLFRRCQSNRLRVCCPLPALTNQGHFIVKNSTKFVKNVFAVRHRVQIDMVGKKL